MKKTLFTVCLLLTSGFALLAQTSYLKKQFISQRGDTLSYRLLEPEQTKEAVQYPLVLFMHGAGERGTDNQTQLNIGSGMFENPVNREKYPAYVIFPQCPPSGYWAYSKRPGTFNPDSMPILKDPTPLIQNIKELIDAYCERPEIDKSRIYVVGLSMGGMATFDLAIRYPQLFAAAVPICGTVNPERLKHSVAIPFRIFHGDADNIVPVSASRKAYRSLKQAGASVEYIEYPSVNHGSWIYAFNEPDFLDWIFKQHKNPRRK